MARPGAAVLFLLFLLLLFLNLLWQEDRSFVLAPRLLPRFLFLVTSFQMRLFCIQFIKRFPSLMSVSFVKAMPGNLFKLLTRSVFPAV